MTSLICLKNISWKYLWLFKNITQKWFRADKIDVRALKTLKRWNVAFWKQCINQSDMWAHIFMLFISAVWFTNHLAVLACQLSSNYQCRSTFFNRNKLKLKPIYKKGYSGTGVFLRIMRNTYITKWLWRLQVNRWKIWIDILIVRKFYWSK